MSKIDVGGKMRKSTFYQLGRAILFGITLFAVLTMAPGSSIVAKALNGPEMPPNDVLVLPAIVNSRQSVVERYLALAPDPSYSPGYYDTSVYMLGNVAVGIILPESAGAGENWTSTEQNTVVNEIKAGLNWWKTTGGELANLTFEYDIHLGVPTTYEPINHPQHEEGLWISDVLSNLGYTSGDYWAKVYAYENDLRNQYGTDWVFTIFVVDSSADVDGKFADGYFAYAYMGGPFLVMTYDNNGWGIGDMDKVTAHETGHIFWAGDQYGSCSTTTKYGYLGVVNGNCNGNPSIMRDNSLVVDSFARGQIGWQDSDSDNIPDVLDTTPIVALAPYSPNPTLSSTLSYSGNVKSPAYPHAVCGVGDWCYTKDVTTQSIDNVNYQVDSGTWNSTTAQDGAFDSDVEDFSFSTGLLTPGTHSFKLTSENSSGNMSATWSDSVIINAPAQVQGVGKYDGTHSEWVFTGVWSHYTTSTIGPYNNTLTYSTTVGSEAQFVMSGTQFILTYNQYTNRGVVDIYVDGALVHSLNENGALQWQKTWTSPVLSNGTHTLRFVHASGAMVDLDAIEVLGPDTTAPGAITLSAVTGPASGTVSLNWTAPGDDGATGTASSYLVRYSTSAINDQTAWNNATAVTTGVPTPKAAGGAESMLVDGLTPGATYYFAVRAQDEVPNLGALSNSPSAMANNTPPLGAGKYDGTHSGWSYSSGWTHYTTSTSGPYNNTITYSTTIGREAQFVMIGNQFTLSYTQYTNRGVVDIYVDGSKVNSLNQNGALQWQKTWTSPVLSDGTHTLRFVHASGTMVDLDAIEVLGVDTIAPAAITLSAVTGPASGTVSLNWTAPGDDGASGTASLYLVRYSTSAINDQTAWNNATAVPTGVPTPKAAGGAESMLVDGLTPGATYYFAVRAQDEVPNLGALSNSPSAVANSTPPPGAGKYDGTHSGWSYSSGWTHYTTNGPYNRTLTYSTTVGSEAQFVMTGNQFILSYTQYTNRGVVDIYVDGALVHSLNENGALQWQKTWTSANLGAGIHTLRFVHASGAYVDLDAIEIFGPDATAPGAITLSAATGIASGSVLLNWTAPGDDGTSGTASSYLVRYSTSAISDETAWNNATAVTTDVPTPKAAGGAESMQVSDLTPGVTYYFAVRAQDEVPNLGALSNSPSAEAKYIPPPPNDDFDSATIISSFPFAETVDVFSATLNADDPDIVNCNAIPDGYSVWYKFTPTTQGIVTVDTLGSAYDTVVAIWTGTRTNLQPVACNDDKDGVTWPSELAAYVSSGTTYYIEVDQKRFATSPSPDKMGAPDLAKALVLNANLIPVSSPLGAGKYDGTHSGWYYSSGWSHYTTIGPYNNTLTYSTTPGSSAFFIMTGTQFTLTYNQYTNRGVVDIYVDGSKVNSLNQNGALQWQKTWTSPVLSGGVHTLKFVHASGAVVDLDAIEVFGVDTIAPAAITLSAVTGPASGTVSLNWTAPGDDGATGTASSYLVRYSTSAINDQTAWNNATAVTTGVPTPKAAGGAESMLVGGLTPGTTYYFAVRAQDEVPNLGALSNSPSAVADNTPPPGAGKYDGTHSGWSYSSGWTHYTTNGPYNNTLTYSQTVGNEAQFVMTGYQFALTYNQYTNRGIVDIYVDGSKVNSLNQNGALQWQKTWTSPVLSNGTHTLRFVHASGAMVDLDAIEVFGVDVTAPGAITLSAVTGPVSGTVSLNWTAPGDDGTSGMASSYLVRYSTSAISDQTAWNNATAVPTGVPTPKATGGAESMLVGGLTPGTTYYFAVRAQDEVPNLGALSNSPSAMANNTPPPGAGKYDGTHSGWTYSSGWLHYTTSGPYNNTLTYSETVGNEAQFVMTGTQFTLTYNQYTNRGIVDIYVDGALVHSLNENGALQWQKTWTSANLGAGIHTLRFVHASGAMVDLDAIEVFP